MSITSADVRFKIEYNLNNSPKDITFTDLQQGYTDTTKIEGLLAIKDPTGTWLYKNTGYDGDSFTSPDIDGSGATWSVSSINLPVDTYGDVVTGTYSIYYKVRDTDVGTVYTIANSYNYSITNPTMDIDAELDYDASTLEITDDTSYGLKVQTGATVTQTSISRAWVVACPSKYSTGNITDTTSSFTMGAGSSKNSGKNLWTGEYAISLSSTLQYTMGTWSSTDTTAFAILNVVFTESEVVTAINGDCFGDLHTCIEALESNYQTQAEQGGYKQKELQWKRNELAWQYLRYISSKRTGADVSEVCAKMAEILGTECTSTSSSVSTEIIPITGSSSSGGSGGQSMITFGSGASGLPTAPMKNQMHIFNSDGGSYSDGDVYYYNGVTSAWVDQGNIVGAAGASGDTVIPVLHNSITDAADVANTSEQTLKTYTLPEDTIDTNGSYLIATSYFTVKSGITTTLRLNFGSTVVFEKSVSPSVDTKYVVGANIYRTGSAAQTSESYYTVIGVPDGTVTNALAASTEDFTSDIDLTVTSQKVATGSTSDVVCNYLRVEKAYKQ